MTREGEDNPAPVVLRLGVDRPAVAVANATDSVQEQTMAKKRQKQ
jgi:hypothetical protein